MSQYHVERFLRSHGRSCLALTCKQTQTLANPGCGASHKTQNCSRLIPGGSRRRGQRVHREGMEAHRNARKNAHSGGERGMQSPTARRGGADPTERPSGCGPPESESCGAHDPVPTQPPEPPHLLSPRSPTPLKDHSRGEYKEVSTNPPRRLHHQPETSCQTHQPSHLAKRVKKTRARLARRGGTTQLFKLTVQARKSYKAPAEVATRRGRRGLRGSHGQKLLKDPCRAP